MAYRDESYGSGNLRALPSVVVGSLHVLNDLGYGQGHDGRGSDRHILGGGKELGAINTVIGMKAEAGTHTVDGDADEG